MGQRKISIASRIKVARELEVKIFKLKSTRDYLAKNLEKEALKVALQDAFDKNKSAIKILMVIVAIVFFIFGIFFGLII